MNFPYFSNSFSLKTEDVVSCFGNIQLTSLSWPSQPWLMTHHVLLAARYLCHCLNDIKLSETKRRKIFLIVIGILFWYNCLCTHINMYELNCNILSLKFLSYFFTSYCTVTRCCPLVCTPHPLHHRNTTIHTLPFTEIKTGRS